MVAMTLAPPRSVEVLGGWAVPIGCPVVDIDGEKVGTVAGAHIARPGAPQGKLASEMGPVSIELAQIPSPESLRGRFPVELLVGDHGQAP